MVVTRVAANPIRVAADAAADLHTRGTVRRSLCHAKRHGPWVEAQGINQPIAVKEIQDAVVKRIAVGEEAVQIDRLARTL